MLENERSQPSENPIEPEDLIARDLAGGAYLFQSARAVGQGL
jgi:hypothetical protein